ncbi:hypothetical protein TKK_0006911 [Trichogramma kaykai]
MAFATKLITRGSRTSAVSSACMLKSERRQTTSCLLRKSKKLRLREYPPNSVLMVGEGRPSGDSPGEIQGLKGWPRRWSQSSTSNTYI